LEIDKLSPTFHASRVQTFLEFDLPRICFRNKLFEDLVNLPEELAGLSRLEGLLLEFHSKGTEIFRQEDEATGLSLIVSGTIRVAREAPGGATSVNFLLKNQYFGIASVFENAKRTATLSAVTDVALITFPNAAIRKVCERFPGLLESLREEWRQQARVDVDAERLKRLPPANPPEHLVHKLLQGRNLLLIDMDLCTRCDQCVRACAAAHDDVPRFHRANPDLRFGKWEVAAACVHCVDAPCQQACPVGAITFLPNGMVHIHRSRCIGCRSCVDPCPFDVIEMLTRSSPEEAPVTSANKAFAVATKCDLCLTDTRDPPCVASCPYDAAQRGAPDELFPGIGQLDLISSTMTISTLPSSFDLNLAMEQPKP
jgi:Fe-S-cluster-containing hydrogenase component 2/CRP-like cAMP-binding protein